MISMSLDIGLIILGIIVYKSVGIEFSVKHIDQITNENFIFIFNKSKQNEHYLKMFDHFQTKVSLSYK
ncbi:hypothetical protein HZS_3738 [Henneguya salminicola]|nr:hypothetical protein HZS_3738 [Henneguya salminicola]